MSRPKSSLLLDTIALMLNSLNTHYIQPMRSFNRDARLFLWMTIINGIIFSGWQLFFNIFMLEQGFGRDFLGLINSLPSLSGLLLGIPIGRLSDRIGRKPSLLIGIVFTSLALFGQISLQQRPAIIMMSALVGVFNMLIIVSVSPLMMKLSTEGNRTLLFSLNYGLQTIAGAFGSIFAGQLPGFFGQILDVGATSAPAYQAVLVTTILIGTTALIPLSLMSEPKTAPPPDPRRASAWETRTRLLVPPDAFDRQTCDPQLPDRFRRSDPHPLYERLLQGSVSDIRFAAGDSLQPVVALHRDRILDRSAAGDAAWRQDPHGGVHPVFECDLHAHDRVRTLPLDRRSGLPVPRRVDEHVGAAV